jgi:uncharacterized membrane protein YfcA
MRPVWMMIPGMIIGAVVGAYITAKYTDAALGLMLPLEILLLVGISLLDYTGRIDEWMRSPEMNLP